MGCAEGCSIMSMVGHGRTPEITILKGFSILLTKIDALLNHFETKQKLAILFEKACHLKTFVGSSWNADIAVKPDIWLNLRGHAGMNRLDVYLSLYPSASASFLQSRVLYALLHYTHNWVRARKSPCFQ